MTDEEQKKLLNLRDNYGLPNYWGAAPKATLAYFEILLAAQSPLLATLIGSGSIPVRIGAGLGSAASTIVGPGGTMFVQSVEVPVSWTCSSTDVLNANLEAIREPIKKQVHAKVADIFKFGTKHIESLSTVFPSTAAVKTNVQSWSDVLDVYEQLDMAFDSKNQPILPPIYANKETIDKIYSVSMTESENQRLLSIIERNRQRHDKKRH